MKIDNLIESKKVTTQNADQNLCDIGCKWLNESEFYRKFNYLLIIFYFIINPFDFQNRCWLFLIMHQLKVMTVSNSQYSIVNSELASHLNQLHLFSVVIPKVLNWDVMVTSKTEDHLKCIMSLMRKIIASSPPPWDSRFIQEEVLKDGNNANLYTFISWQLINK